MSHPEKHPPPYSEEDVSRVPPPPYDPVLYSLPSQSNTPVQTPGLQVHPPRTVVITRQSDRQNPAYHTRTPVTEPTLVIEEDISWVPALSSIASHLNGKAVVGGHDIDGSPVWVIRAKHYGYVVPGKFSVRNNTASIAFGSKEVNVKHIEVLCGKPENLQWVPANNGVIPSNAIKGGKTTFGATIYVGRTRYHQTMTPGRVQKKDKCHIGFGGAVVSVQAYEVLCTIR